MNTRDIDIVMRMMGDFVLELEGAGEGELAEKLDKTLGVWEEVDKVLTHTH